MIGKVRTFRLHVLAVSQGRTGDRFIILNCLTEYRIKFEENFPIIFFSPRW